MSYIIKRTEQYRDELESLRFTFAGDVLNPLVYAWAPHKLYLERYIRQGTTNLFLGINPGPFGMVQTGIPFGEIGAARDFLHCEAPVEQPEKPSVGRPVLGFGVKRSEISGLRLWGLMRERYGSAENSAKENAVMNYCALAFIEGKKNVTPDKLAKEERGSLWGVCDSYLKDIVEYIDPKNLVGVGALAEGKLREVAGGRKVVRIIHPSPGNPQANDKAHPWAEKTEATLIAEGVWNEL